MVPGLCLFALLFGPLAAGQSSAGATRPNVLVIVWDDVGAEDIETLPLVHLDGLRGVGRTFARSYVSPVCSPTRYQLQFGRFPHRANLGKALNSDQSLVGVDPREISLAEVLHVHGYRTACFGKWHLNAQAAGARAEFARLHGFNTWRAGSPDNLPKVAGAHYDWRRYDDGVETDESVYSSIAITDALLGWWQSTPGPKFALCNYLAPHEPFDPPPFHLVPGFVFPPTKRGHYVAAVVALDALLGQILATVDLSDTYVIWIADNGTPHQVKPPNGLAKGYKTTPYEGGIRVPLVVAGPRVLPGEDNSLVQAVDLPRTLAELAGTTAPPSWRDSLSFAGALGGGAGQRPWAFVQRYSPHGAPAVALDVNDWAVVRADGFKLLRYGEHYQLFHLTTDPWEQAPLALADHSEVVAALEAIRAEALGPAWSHP